MAQRLDEGSNPSDSTLIEALTLWLVLFFVVTNQARLILIQ